LYYISGYMIDAGKALPVIQGYRIDSDNKEIKTRERLIYDKVYAMVADYKARKQFVLQDLEFV